MLVARPAVRAAVPSLAAALLVVIGAVLVVLLRSGGPGSLPGGVVATPTPSPTALPTPVATATPTAVADRCTANELHLTVTSVEGAAGSRIFNFTIRNDGPARCTLNVFRAAVVDDGQTPPKHLVSADQAPAPKATLAAGAKVNGAARWSNECSKTYGPLVLTLDLTSRKTLEGTVPGDTAFATPPCNGPNASSLEIRFGT